MSWQVYIIVARPGLREWADAQLGSSEPLPLPKPTMIKIGISEAPEKRKNTAPAQRSPGLAECCRLEETIHVGSRAHALAIERALHAYMEHHTLGNEWFSATPYLITVCAAMAHAAAEVPIEPLTK
jgi:hypothetical protein